MSQFLFIFSLFFLVFHQASCSLGWAGWSQWSPCSKTCGGGISHQLRRCLDTKCSGEAQRHRVCAQKDCETKSRSARDTVCGGEEIVSKQQCEVVCRSRQTNAKFLWRVDDGTPCQAATSRAVCTKGICQMVGCDGLVGSSFRFDACGVCGGRGDTCENGKFVWKQSEEYTACASSCDEIADLNGSDRSIISYSQPIVVCVNAATKRVVPERLCADKPRPKTDVRPCPPLICPSRWMAADWTECVPYCGIGTRRREVYCVQTSQNNTVHVSDSYCANYTRPSAEEECVSTSCGRWETSRWSRCSSSCGQGIRRRSVACVGGTDCEATSRPRQETTCYAGIPCSVVAKNSLDWNDRTYLDSNTLGSMDSNDWQSPRLLAGEWSQCSSTCGTGVMSRTIECVAVNPISSAPIKLPMSECQGQEQPKLFESCEVRSCPLQEDSKLSEEDDTSPFQWRYGDWTQCSESCLGGKQKAALKCVQISTGKSVQWSQCDARRRPLEKSRACNQHPCPPFWLISKFGECSTSCGGGVTRRSVKCAQTVSKTDGADAHIILRDDRCHLKKPIEIDDCNLISCPPTWVTAQWTECSKSCDNGERRRQVWCEVRDARGKTARRLDIECDASTKPASVEMCSFGSCSRPDLLSNRIFEQNAEQKKLTLGIGGVATLYQGTSIKIKCPAKKFDKKKVYWKKNGKRIKNDAHIKVSGNGNLRVFHARMEDAGVYECFTDQLQGNVTLNFKYRDFSANRVDQMDKNRIPSQHKSKSKLKSKLRNQKEDEESKNRIKSTKSIDIKLIDALLSSPNDEKVKQELQKYGNELIAKWEIGHWSECRQKTCHVAGYQARSLTCKLSLNTEVRLVDNTICELLSSTRPPETRPCHREDCPRWEASDWSDCTSMRCVSTMTAQKRRNVTCRFSNSTIVDNQLCDVTNRPLSTIDCPNQNCKAEWRTSDWGSCSSECGTGGVQLRLLSCVWISSGRPAGRNCEQMRRPHSARACVSDEPLPPCSPTASALFQRDSSCQDQSRFCDIIKLFHSCDSLEVRQKCCSTCTFVERRKF